MKIILASDHAGIELKNKMKGILALLDHTMEDMGAFEFKEEDDYPTIMIPVAMKVAGEAETRAIIFGKSGQGEAMVVNRFPGVHATVYYAPNLEIIRLAREHNDSNILSIGAGFINEIEAEEAVRLWLSTPFSGDERHVRRLEQADNIQ